jgi:hypothetical protein
MRRLVTGFGKMNTGKLKRDTLLSRLEKTTKNTPRAFPPKTMAATDKIQISQAEWVEVWISYIYYNYVLLLYGFKDGTLKIYDPQEKHIINEIFSTYYDADLWFGDDEFTRIDTRI